MTHPRNEFGLRLLFTSRLWRREADAAVRRYGLSEATVLPILQLSRMGDGTRQNALAARLGIEGPSLVPQLDALEKAGYLTRRPDPADRRAKALYLTAQGKVLLKKIDPILDEIRQALLAEVSDAELATCFSVLEKIEAAAAKRRPLQA
ncbi:MAG TPA: MarR family transcriptional regulator [Parvibaculum sp.]|jgi:MarR family transcriptional regulator for hemolysin